MEKVLITGISGGQGRLLARRLLENYEVCGVDVAEWEGAPRGVRVHVVDLRKRLSETPTISEQTRVIILRLDDHPVGVLVDNVLEVHRLDAGDISAPPAMVRGLAAKYIAGLLPRDDETVVMLNAGKLFSSTERLQLTDAGAKAGSEA